LAKLVDASDEFRSVGWTLKTGMQSLYDAISADLEDVRYNATVEAIYRSDNVVRVQLSSGESIVADHVISSLPIPKTMKLLKTPSKIEIDAANDIKAFAYYTTIVRCQGLSRFPAGFHVIPAHNDPDTCSSMIGHVVAWHNRYPETNVYLFYSFARDQQSGQVVIDLLKDDVVELGGQMLEVISQKAWDYFPYAHNPGAFYKKLDTIQGYKHLWHVGGVFNVELMEPNMVFAQRLVKENFLRADGMETSPTPSRRSRNELTDTERFCFMHRFGVRRPDHA